MKLFLSWSGIQSHAVAVILKDCIKCVLNDVEPFVSSEDIRKGNRWLIEISKELEEAHFGIICLTRDNLTLPWVIFEAGALSKSIDRSRVCTLLMDGLTPSTVDGPLSHFQATQFDKEDFRKLVFDINRALGERQLPENILSKSFEKWWDELEQDIREIPPNTESLIQARPDSEILSELLDLCRFVARSVRRSPSELSKPSFPEKEFRQSLLEVNSMDAILSPHQDEWNHPVLIRIGPIFRDNEEKELVKLTVRRGQIRVEQMKDAPDVRGVSIELYFHTEVGPYWLLDLSFHKGMTIGRKTIVDQRKAVELGLTEDTIWRD